MNLLFRNNPAGPRAMLALALSGLLCCGAAQAQAVGTAAGSAITNLATLNYSVGGTTQTPIGSSATGNTTGAGTATSFVVDNKINMLVTTSDATYVSVVPGQTLTTATASQVATFLVTNTGNSPQDFSLSTANLANGATLFGGTDNFNPTACDIRVESGGVAGYDAATDTATFIDELASGASKTVYVICAIPLAQVNDDVSVISLTAEARAGGTAGGTVGAALTQSATNDPALVDIVFADVAGTDDIARDAKHSSRDAFKVVTARLTVTKTVVPVCDPLNGNTTPKNIPGSFVRYTITVANTGASSATLTTVTDTLATTLVTFDPDMIAGATAAACVSGSAPVAGGAAGRGFNLVQANRNINSFWTSASDADGIEFATPTITVNFATVLPAGGAYTAGELKATESVSVVYQVQIQ